MTAVKARNATITERILRVLKFSPEAWPSSEVQISRHWVNISISQDLEQQLGPTIRRKRAFPFHAPCFAFTRDHNMKRALSCFTLAKPGERLSIFLTISAGFYLDNTSGSLS